MYREMRGNQQDRALGLLKDGVEWDVPGQTKRGQRGPSTPGGLQPAPANPDSKWSRGCDWWPGSEPHPSHLLSIWERGTLLRKAPPGVLNHPVVAWLVNEPSSFFLVPQSWLGFSG